MPCVVTLIDCFVLERVHCTAPEMIPNPEMIPKSTPKWCRPRNDPHFSSRRPRNVGSSNRCAEWRWSDMSDPFKQDLREFEERKLNRAWRAFSLRCSRDTEKFPDQEIRVNNLTIYEPSWHSTWRHSRANMLYKFYIYLVSSITPRSLAALTGSSSFVKRERRKSFTIGSHLPAAKYD